MHIGPILHQELHADQAPLLDGDVEGAVASVVLIHALGVDQRMGIARVPVNLQQRLDAGVGPIPKVSQVIDISPGNLDSNCTSSSQAFHMMNSSYKLNKQGDNIQP